MMNKKPKAILLTPDVIDAKGDNVSATPNAISHNGRIFLAAYFINIQKKREKKAPQDPYNYDAHGARLEDDLNRLLSSLNFKNAADGARTFAIQSVKYNKKFGAYECTAMCGAYGREFRVRKIHSDEIVYQGNNDDVPEQEFNFVFKFRPGRLVGHIIFQRNSTWGIRTTFLKALRSVWDIEGYVIHITPCAIKKVIDNYLKTDKTTEISFIQHNIPQSVFGKLNFFSRKADKQIPPEKLGKIEIKIKANRNSFISGVSKLLYESEKPQAGIVDVINVKDFRPEQMSFILEGPDGRKKNFVLKKDKEPRTYLDITDDVVKSGNADRKKIFDEIHSLISTFP